MRHSPTSFSSPISNKSNGYGNSPKLTFSSFISNSPVLNPVPNSKITQMSLTPSNNNRKKSSSLTSKKEVYESYLPFDKMLESIEDEGMIESESGVAFHRVFDKQSHERYTQIVKVVKNEKEYLTLLEQIQQYQSVKHPGLVSIQKWSCDLSLDKNMKKIYKFLIMVDWMGDRLDQRFKNDGDKQFLTSFRREEFHHLINLISGMQYLFELKGSLGFSIAPMLPCNLCFSSDNSLKFIPQIFLQTQNSQRFAEQHKSMFCPPESDLMICHEKTVIFQIGMSYLIFLTNEVKNEANKSSNEIKRLLNLIKKSYTDDQLREQVRNLLEKMTSFQIESRFNFTQSLEFCQSIEETIQNESIPTDCFFTSDNFHYFARSGIVNMNQPKQKYIATIFPFTKRKQESYIHFIQVVQSNLFDEKNIFIEQYDMSMDMLLPEDSQLLSGENFEVKQYLLVYAISLLFEKVWIIGGKKSNMLYQLNEEVPNLTPLSPIPCSYQRFSFGLCNIGSKYIFIAGGFIDDQPKPCSKMEKYDVSENKWYEMKECLPASGCTLVIFQEKAIYKFGGKDRNGDMMNKIERFDIDSNTWQVIPFRLQKGVEQISLFKAIGVQINPCQILIGGGYEIEKKEHTHIQNPNLNFFYLNIDEEATNRDKFMKEVFIEFSQANKIKFPPQKKKDMNEQQKYDFENQYIKSSLSKYIQIDFIAVSLNSVWFIHSKSKESKQIYSYNHKTNIIESKKINY